MEGIGDDCAVIYHNDEATLYSTDLVVEGVHFLREFSSPYEVGKKSLNVNISDIAAMGGTPVASLLSLSLPHDAQQEWVEEFMKGYHEVSEEYNVALIGGDTTSSIDKISVCVTIIGQGKRGELKHRCDAMVGDIVAVSGRLGESARGLSLLRNGIRDGREVEFHLAPRAQVREGIFLGKQPAVHAMMDLSDGLASDIRHILKASHVGAEINIENIPTCGNIEEAVCGGEDYKLLLTVEASQFENLNLQFLNEFGYSLCPVGRITSKKNTLTWLDKGVAINPSWKGYEHF